MERIIINRWYQPDCTIGRLTYGSFQCLTLELPWKNNQRNISCIPEGIYKAKKRISPGKGYQVIEYIDVPDRTYIQIHYGNYTRQILGCQLPGDGIKWLDGDSILDVTNSKPTLKKLLSLLPDKFEIEIRGPKNAKDINYYYIS